MPYERRSPLIRHARAYDTPPRDAFFSCHAIRYAMPLLSMRAAAGAGAIISSAMRRDSRRYAMLIISLPLLLMLQRRWRARASAAHTAHAAARHVACRRSAHAFIACC